MRAELARALARRQILRHYAGNSSTVLNTITRVENNQRLTQCVGTSHSYATAFLQRSEYARQAAHGIQSVTDDIEVPSTLRLHSTSVQASNSRAIRSTSRRLET
jgi:hypothetical protein